MSVSPERPRRWPRAVLALGAVGAVALVLQGTAVRANPEAPASDARPTVSRPAVSVESHRADQAEEFTECMRANGVPDFPGITIQGNGSILLNGGGAFEPLSSAYRAAAAKCAGTLSSAGSLPKDPAPPSPAVPEQRFTCEGELCPVPPKAPSLPF